MDDFDKKTNGELNGFDSVNENETQESGYTVTPDGGFYTKSREDIIQDETVNSTAYSAVPENNAQQQAPANEQPQQNSGRAPGSFFPNGEYSAYSNQYQTNQYGAYQGQNTQPVYGYKPSKPKKEKKPRNKKYGAGIVAVAALLAAVIGAASGIAAVKFTSEKNTSSLTPSTVSGSNVNINIDETAESVVEAVAQKVTPSVVGIRTTTSVMSFFGGSSEATGEGSGVVYSSDGYIITNYHVVSDALSNKSGSKIEVFIDSLDSDPYSATVVGYNIASDLAVIKIDATGLTPVEFADSSD